MITQVARYATTPFRKAAKLLRGEKLFADVRPKEMWDNDFRTGRWQQLVSQHDQSGNMAVIAHLLLFSVGDGPKRLLDVGCGNGALARTLSLLKRDFEYVGTDISSEGLSQLQSAHPTATTVCANMLDVDAMPGDYDIILFAECLYHVDYDLAVRLYRTKLRPGGFVIVSLPSEGNGRILWPSIGRQLSKLQSFTVRNDQSRAKWTVKLMQYK